MIHPNSKIEPFDLVIFGATGDLCLNKILPALLYRDMDGQLPQMSRVICSSRSNISEENYKILVLKKFESLKKFENYHYGQLAKYRVQKFCSVSQVDNLLNLRQNGLYHVYLARIHIYHFLGTKDYQKYLKLTKNGQNRPK